MEDTILVLEFPIFGEDFDHLGDATLRIRESLLKALNTPILNASKSREKEIVRKSGICLYEAEANIVIHAKFGFIKTILYKQKIVSIAKDIGPGIKNLILALKPGYSTASEKARMLGFGAGMGLKNIEKISDFFFLISTFGKGTYLLFEVWRNNTTLGGVKMKIRKLIEELKLEVLTNFTEKDLDKIVEEAYTCDLLSNVLSKAEEETTWITVQSNINVVGVATIKRIPIIIVTESNTPEEETLKKAELNSIIIARTKLSSFEISGQLYNLLKKQN